MLKKFFSMPKMSEDIIVTISGARYYNFSLFFVEDGELLGKPGGYIRQMIDKT
jgi:hypothetical protein